MDFMNLINFLARWGHVIFGVTWIGLLYYFNFIQGGYFKQATPEGLKDAKEKLAPEALWWFRWAAAFTLLTGLLLVVGLEKSGLMNVYITVGALMGILMFLNVWLIIWPNQKIALGMVPGDAAKAAGKALLASRTNTLFSAPMLFFMLAGPHFINGGGYGAKVDTGSLGLWLVLAIVAALEINGIVGKQGPLSSVKGVIHCSIALALAMAAMLVYL